MRYKNRLIKIDENSIKHLYAVGDIHGEFATCVDDLINSCKLKDSAVICCGDIGLGFFSSSKLIQIFNKIHPKLVSNNVILIFFRGNHDDPEWFDYKEDEFAEAFPNLIIAEDFTIVEYNFDNVLLWGGARSVDMKMRQLGKSYWNGEMPKPLPEEFANEDKNISIVCTHTAPSFCLPYSKKGIADFCKYDPSLKDDCEYERNLLADGCEQLYRNNRYSLTTWVYGHFHETFYNYHDMNELLEHYAPIQFIGLDMMRFSSHDVNNFNFRTHGVFNRVHKNNILLLASNK